MAGLCGRRRRDLRIGDAVEGFVRPEVVSLGRTPAELPAGQPAHAGEVESLLFDGANSAVLLKEARTRREFRIALPADGPLLRSEAGGKGAVQLRAGARRLLSCAADRRDGRRVT